MRQIDQWDHLLKIDRKTQILHIYRVFNDGSQDLYTSVELPNLSSKTSNEQFESFSRMLGENLLLDSPIARDLLDL